MDRWCRSRRRATAPDASRAAFESARQLAAALRDLRRDRAQELFQRHIGFLAGPILHIDMAGLDFLAADDRHEWHLFHLGVADLAIEALGAAVEMDAHT